MAFVNEEQFVGKGQMSTDIDHYDPIFNISEAD